MRKSVFAIFDRTAGEMTGPLFVMPTEAAARRVFSDAILAESGPLTQHPDDYSLHHVGDLDVTSGRFDPVGTSHDPFHDANAVVTGGQIVRDFEARNRSVSDG